MIAPRRGRERRLALAVAAVSAAIIAFQLVVMQLFALAQWHHFGYMVISMALLGFGAAGTAVVLWRAWLVRHYAAALPLLCLGTCVAMAASVWLAGLFGRFDAYLLFFDAAQLAWLLGAYAVYALPFLLGGMALTLVFDREVQRIGMLYAASLAGSAGGAAGVVALLWLLPPAPLAGVLALLPLLAAGLLRPPGRASPQAAAAGLAALAVVAMAIVRPAEAQPSQYKPIHAALQLPDARVVHRAHSPYGQLEVVRAPALRYAPGLSLRYAHEPPVRDVVFNNGQLFGTLLGRAAPGTDHVLDHTTMGLPYALQRPASVLVLDAATGSDVSHALHHGAGRIVAVEPHAQANRLLRDLHPEWIDGLYRDPAVQLLDRSVRAHLSADEAQYDLIVLPVLGAFGGSSGAMALHERYELTLQAFDAMWRRLSDHGMIVLSAWDDQPPRLTLRALATLRAALARQGLHDVASHLLALRGWGTVTFVIGRQAWTAAQLDDVRRFAAERGFDPLLLPGLEPAERERFNRVADRGGLDAVDALLGANAAALVERYPFDLRPVGDERPYFEHFMRASGLRPLLASYGVRQLPYVELGFFFGLVTFVQIVVVAPLLILLPLLRVGWAGTRRRWTLLYFAGTGIGFIAFEIVLMQRLVLYLGHPVYAAAAVLTALLLSAGLGSLASSRLPATPHTLVAAGMSVVALILLYAWGLTPALEASMAWSLPARAAAVLGLLAPPAFAMGLLFPLGLRRLARSDHSHVAWACGIDHSLSVAATAGATLLALELGFGAVMLAAAAAYVAVAAAGSRLGASA